MGKQQSSDLADCCRGGDHVIHDRDVQSVRIFIQRERAAKVMHALPCAEGLLRFGMSDSSAQPAVEREPGAVRKHFGDFQGLVEAAFSQALLVKWYRDEDIRKVFGGCCVQPLMAHRVGEHLANDDAVAFLELVYQSIDGPCIEKWCKAPGKRGRRVDAPSAQVTGADWQPATPAGVGDPGQVALAAHTQVEMPVGRRFAKDTSTWDQAEQEMIQP